jgi:hypothetical protein
MTGIRRIALIFAQLIIAVAGAVFAAPNSTQDGITWGVNFSQSQAEYLGLNWKETYLSIVDDLGAKNLKLITNWSWIEGKRDEFYFSDVDWQIQQAEQRDVKIIYVLGMKTGRWPECHIPDWAQDLPKREQQQELLQYMTQVVLRYKSSKAIAYWQVENEPLFKFGRCPSWYYRGDRFLKSEVSLVRELDPSRRIIISDSGERSNWQDAAEIGDIVGTTMYRTNVKRSGFWSYSFLDASFYSQKAETIKNLFGRDVICIELQAEPWPSKPLLEAPLAEQLKSMNPEMLKENIEFAESTGLKAFYLWGAEWWYWMKTKQGQPELWNEAKEIFKN